MRESPKPYYYAFLTDVAPRTGESILCHLILSPSLVAHTRGSGVHKHQRHAYTISIGYPLSQCKHRLASVVPLLFPRPLHLITSIYSVGPSFMISTILGVKYQQRAHMIIPVSTKKKKKKHTVILISLLHYLQAPFPSDLLSIQEQGRVSTVFGLCGLLSHVRNILIIHAPSFLFFSFFQTASG